MYTAHLTSLVGYINCKGLYKTIEPNYKGLLNKRQLYCQLRNYWWPVCYVLLCTTCGTHAWAMHLVVPLAHNKCACVVVVDGGQSYYFLVEMLTFAIDFY